jgi:hypothetical protein
MIKKTFLLFFLMISNSVLMAAVKESYFLPTEEDIVKKAQLYIEKETGPFIYRYNLIERYYLQKNSALKSRNHCEFNDLASMLRSMNNELDQLSTDINKIENIIHRVIFSLNQSNQAIVLAVFYTSTVSVRDAIGKLKEKFNQ